MGEFENGTWAIWSIEQTGLDKPCPGGGKLLLQSAFQSCFECLRNSLGHPCMLGGCLWKEWPADATSSAFLGDRDRDVLWEHRGHSLYSYSHPSPQHTP